MAKPSHYVKYGQLLILSVDDDQVNLMVIEQLLSPQGWKVRVCHTLPISAPLPIVDPQLRVSCAMRESRLCQHWTAGKR